jgi:uncharacterized membrane protein
MTSRIVASLVLAAVLIGAAAQGFYYYPLLPPRVASHFGAGGEPDGWTTRGAFMATYAGTLLFTAGMMAGLAVLVPRLPMSMVNVPHKPYWSAPEHRGRLASLVGSFLLWMGAVTVLFLAALMQRVFAANLRPPPRLGEEIWWMLVVYFAVVALLLGRLMWPLYTAPRRTAV